MSGGRSCQRLGYWPLLHNEKWRRDAFDLTGLLTQTDSSRGVTVFVDIYPSTDFQNASRRIINVLFSLFLLTQSVQIDQSSLGLGSGARDYYLNETKYAKQLHAYKRYIIAKASVSSEKERRCGCR